MILAIVFGWKNRKCHAVTSLVFQLIAFLLAIVYILFVAVPYLNNLIIDVIGSWYDEPKLNTLVDKLSSYRKCCYWDETDSSRCSYGSISCKEAFSDSLTGKKWIDYVIVIVVAVLSLLGFSMSIDTLCVIRRARIYPFDYDEEEEEEECEEESMKTSHSHSHHFHNQDKKEN